MLVKAGGNRSDMETKLSHTRTGQAGGVDSHQSLAKETEYDFVICLFCFFENLLRLGLSTPFQVMSVTDLEGS